MELEQIMKQRVFAVAGDTINEEKYACKIKRELAEHGYTVYGVGKELKSFQEIQEEIDIIDLCINPARGLALMKDCKKACKCVVIQPGAESIELFAYLRERKIPFIEGCLLVGLRLYGNR